MAWERVEKAIRAADPASTAAVVAGLDAADRKEVGARLPGLLRELAKDPWGCDRSSGALRAAGAGCLAGAAAAAAWLHRRELRTPMWREPGEEEDTSRAVLSVLEGRPRVWRLDLAARLAARLRPSELQNWNADRIPWEVSAGLLRAEGEPPPATEAFAAGWLRFREAEPAAADPFFPVLVPVLFAADALGPILLEDAPFADPDPFEESASRGLAEEIVALVAREDLLEGCVRRLLRGGEGRAVAWYVGLHERLAPIAAESAGRLRDYLRLLPAAALPVAEAAFAQIRVVDAAAPLAEEAFAEAAGALLFRPERKLLRSTLGWLDRTAAGRERATVAAAVAAFAIEHPDTRERAVRLVLKHKDAVDPRTAQEVREASAELPAPLREKVAAAYGGAAEPVRAEAPVLYPVAPRELDPPIASPAGLLPELIAYLHESDDVGPWPEAERLIAGLVAHGGGVFREVRAYAEKERPWLLRKDAHGHMEGVELVFNALVRDRPRGTLDDELRTRLAKAGRASSSPAPARFLRRRFLEAALHLGDPVLLATPTSSTGHVDPEVFAARLRALEEAGAEPGPVDLAQGLLRLPRGTGPLPALAGLGSPAAKTARAWLAADGLPDPDTAFASAVAERLDGFVTRSSPRFPAALRYPEPPEPLAEAAPLLEAKPWFFEFQATATWWPSLLPSHRELTAAHLLGQLRNWPERRLGQGTAALGLADATGPTGRATAAVLLFALSSQHAPERAGALDAVISFAAQDALPAADLGAQLGMFAESGDIVLSRVVRGLSEAARAGVPLWPLFAEAVPALLPAAGTSPARGLNDLLSLATRTAETHGIRTPLPALTTWTPTSRTSRTAKEAATLHATLTAP
ncbi:hypothetical protein EDD29_2889 [Actinocorallia herbida]|uniref:Secreted protein n=2 Tax=Actinocorallia herbida TaxID=58109 RepID=A0A3N1CVP8_9ACTN|nr:hypothetical protein EDD29_2889 [Actinocorallia herbida]